MTDIRLSTYRDDLVPNHKLLADLIAFSDQTKDGLDDIGLLFWDELGYYSCTPKNSIPFATTGIDGDHFGLLPISGLNTTEWPVIMTVPMVCEESSANWIVGRNLHDFLCLGCHDGYSGIAGIACSDDMAQETISELAMSDKKLDHWKEKLKLLRKLRKQFKLKQWTSIEQKLDELQHEFRHHLQFDESPK